MIPDHFFVRELSLLNPVALNLACMLESLGKLLQIPMPSYTADQYIRISGDGTLALTLSINIS